MDDGPTRTLVRLDRAWAALEEHRARLAPLHLRDLFAGDPERFQRFSLRHDDLLFDYSKQRITTETVALLAGWGVIHILGDLVGEPTLDWPPTETG